VFLFASAQLSVMVGSTARAAVQAHRQWANTAIIATNQARAQHLAGDGPPGGGAPWPRISPRSALVATVTGWLVANAWSQPGMVWTGTNTELVNASGKHTHVGGGLDRFGGADHQPSAAITHDQA